MAPANLRRAKPPNGPDELAQVIIDLKTWGLPPVRTRQLAAQCDLQKLPDLEGFTADQANKLASDMGKLREKVNKFRKLPDYQAYISCMAPLRSLALRKQAGAPGPLIIDEIPDALNAAAIVLEAFSVTRQAARTLVESRAICLLFLAVKHACPKCSDRKAYRLIGKLAYGEEPDPTVIRNRIKRFSLSRSIELTNARAVLARSGALGVPRLFSRICHVSGFLPSQS